MTRRSVFAFGLSAILILTAAVFGAARGQAQAAGQVVLCLGGAAVTVTVDRNGQPVRETHYCPDHALTAVAALAVEPPRVIPPVSRATRMSVPLRSGFALTQSTRTRLPRAPPILL